MKKLCNIYVFPSYYRETIYKELDKSFQSTFIFGDEKYRIKKLDLGLLKTVKQVHVSSFGVARFQWGILKYAFKRYDYYLINTDTNYITSWIFLFILRFFRKKKVYLWVHGLYGNESRKQLAIRKLFYCLTDGLFLYGDYSRSLLIKQNINPAKLFVVHNSLDYEKQLALRNTIKTNGLFSSHFGNTNHVIVMIGRLNDRKGLDKLFYAMDYLKQRDETYNAVIIGDGEYRESLEKLVETLELSENVWFYGACYDEERNAELLNNADLCVVPGDVGLTAIHSMMFGVPVITHNYFPTQGPEFEVIKDGVTGAFYNCGNIISLADTISNWFKAHINSREKVREDCYKIIDSEWTPEFQMQVFKEVLGV